MLCPFSIVTFSKSIFKNLPIVNLQLDWLPIAVWAYTSIFTAVVRFQNQGHFRSLIVSKLDETCVFDSFKKSQNELG